MATETKSLISSSQTKNVFLKLPFWATALVALALASLLQKGAYHKEYAQKSIFSHSPISDAAAYDHMARELAQKGNWKDPRVCHHTLGFPLVLAGIYSLFGPRPSAATWFFGFIGLFNVALVLILGCLMGGRTVGVLAALLSLLYGPLLFYETKLMPTTITIFFNLCFLISLTLWRQSAYKSLWKGITAGVLGGITVLLRPNMGFMLVGACLWVSWELLGQQIKQKTESTPIGSPMAALLGVLLILFLGALRVHTATKEWLPLPATGGITLFAGNNPKARGTYTPYKQLTGDKRNQAKEAKQIASRLSEKKPSQLSPRQTSHILTKHVFQWWMKHPWMALKLFSFKLYRFCIAQEPRSSYSLETEKTRIRSLRMAPLTFPVLLVLSLLGLLATRRRQDCFLWIYMAGHLLVSTVFFVSTRYRAPVAPVLAIFAAQGIQWTVAKAPLKKASIGAIVSLILIALLHINPFKNTSNQPFVDSFNEGIALKRQKRNKEALKRFGKAIKLKPSSALARVEKGNALTALGRFQEASLSYKKAIELNKTLYLPHLNLGIIACRRGHIQKGVLHLRRAVALAPKDPMARLRYAQGLLLSGDQKKARAELLQAISLAKGIAPDVALQAKRTLRDLDGTQ